MIKWFINLLYESTPAEFVSDFSLLESVSRLSENVKRHIILTLFKESAVGRVSVSRVRLERAKPFVGNGYKPNFYGEFRERNGFVVLTGAFMLPLFTRVFMSIWFGGIAFGCVLTLSSIFGPDPSRAIGAIFCIAMFSFGCLMMSFSKSRSKGDIEWISNVIRTALENNETKSTLGEGS